MLIWKFVSSSALLSKYKVSMQLINNESTLRPVIKSSQL